MGQNRIKSDVKALDRLYKARAVADAVRGSYPEKYSDRDFVEFIGRATSIKTKHELIQLVENMFDIDTCDAKDMVS